MSQVYHVAVNGDDYNPGSEAQPFKTISRAAEVAVSGDTVIVHEGTYREWVRPRHGGRSSIEQITYKAAEGEKVHIKGSEAVSMWKKYEGTVWVTVLPNRIFEEYNPYRQTIFGDWLFYPGNGVMHTGDVYLNGKSFYEAQSLEEAITGEARESVDIPAYGKKPIKLAHPEDTIYLWYAEVDDSNTTIYGNFHSFDPNKELVEVNVRKYCCFPDRTGVNNIIVKGFEMSQAATTWAPPTANQAGLLGPNWSKGWIIEDNVIHDSKCSGICLGKEASTGDNDSAKYKNHAGYQTQLEAVFKGLQAGWSKEQVGSHIVRNNTIYDCGQNGIVGHMGCAFSTIHHNRVYNIGLKMEYFGWEISAIKFHAPIDVQITENCVHDNVLGIWLDWQTQGTRISRNVFYQNGSDCNIEVSHGPYLFDNNIFASGNSANIVSQGGAWVHNLFCGTLRRNKVLNRATPYHVPHSTQVKGFALIYGADDRYFNNIFIGSKDKPVNNGFYGTSGYDGCTTSHSEFLQKVDPSGDKDLDKYEAVEQPAYINANVYYLGAENFKSEKDFQLNAEHDPQVTVSDDGSIVYLEITTPKDFTSLSTEVQTTESLGTVRIVGAIYDGPEGESIRIDRDLLSMDRGERPAPGPVESLKPGKNEVKVWG